MKTHLATIAFSIMFSLASSAIADQPTPVDPKPAPDEPASSASDTNKKLAQTLMGEAFQFVSDGEHALALTKFQEAYSVFPSPKILLNMGTTMKKLGRYAEAANLYEQYLADVDADPNRIEEVKREFDEADAHVATLRIEVNVADAQVILDGRALHGPSPITVRVDAGSHTVVTEREGHEPQTKTLYNVRGREARVVEVTLVALADVEAAKKREKAEAFDLGKSAALSVIKKQQVATGGRLGAQVSAVAAVQAGGGVVMVLGGSYGVTDRIDASAAAIVGGEQGGYIGGTYYFTTGRVRPMVDLGVPAFYVEGIRPGARASAGLMWLVTQRFGVSLDVGAEHYFSVPSGYAKTLLVSGLGLELRQ